MKRYSSIAAALVLLTAGNAFAQQPACWPRAMASSARRRTSRCSASTWKI